MTCTSAARDNGQALFNPFVGNLLMDAFTTEIGGELYWRSNGMPGDGVGDGRRGARPGAQAGTALVELHRQAGHGPGTSAPPRVRLTGSFYQAPEVDEQHALHRQPRRLALLLRGRERPTRPSRRRRGPATCGWTSAHKVAAWVINPFVKWGRGSRCSATSSRRRGRSNAANDTQLRTWNQYAGDAIYRFLDNQLYVGGRYCTANGPLVFWHRAHERHAGRHGRSLAGRWRLVRHPQPARQGPNTCSRHTATSRRSTFAAAPEFKGGMFEAVVSF